MWAMKNDEVFYRYKNRVKIDGKSKLIDTLWFLALLSKIV